MRVGIVVDHRGGAGRWADALVRGLPQHGIEPELVDIGARGSPSDRLARRPRSSAALAVKSLVDSLRVLAPARAAPPTVDAIWDAALVGNGGHPGDARLLRAAMAAGALGVPVALVVHSEPRRRFVPWLERAADRRMASAVDVVVAVAPTLLGRVADRLPGAAVVAISNGVSDQEPTTREAARVRLGLPVDDVVVVGLGALVPEKRWDVLLEAWRLVPTGTLVIAGDGPLRAELGAGRGRLVGHQSVADVLGAADVYVSSSDQEGLSFALLEAMAAGLPVVATDVGGTADAVVDGVTGRLVPPGRPDLLAAALRSFVTADDDTRSTVGRAARDRWAARLTEAKMVASYAALLRDLKDGRAGG